MSSFPLIRLRGLSSLLAIALLLGACQTNNTQSNEDSEPPLPENELAVEDPWVRPAARGDTTHLYMTLANGMSDADTLVGARAPIFESVQMYEPVSDTSGRSQTEPVESLPISAETRTSLAPAGAKVALQNLDQPFEEGSTILVTLEFAQEGLQRVRAPVQSSAP